MKPIFGRGPSLRLRLLFATLLSISLMIMDSGLDSFKPVRLTLSAVVAPLEHVANFPKLAIEVVGKQLITRSTLQKNNEKLSSQNRMLKVELLQYEELKKENARLRALLGSNLRQDSEKMETEIISMAADPFSLQVVIDKGALDGVYEGQAVINELGIVGQVVLVGPTSSRVILIVDHSHAIPVRLARNDIRAIVQGTGELQELVLGNIPRSTDIKVGDLLLSSGFGQRFPEGYPVARITKFHHEEGTQYAEVVAKPLVEFDKIRHLLLLWPAGESKTMTDKVSSMQAEEQDKVEADD